jgi:hypothetical protein
MPLTPQRAISFDNSEGYIRTPCYDSPIEPYVGKLPYCWIGR